MTSGFPKTIGIRFELELQQVIGLWWKGCVVQVTTYEGDRDEMRTQVWPERQYNGNWSYSYPKRFARGRERLERKLKRGWERHRRRQQRELRIVRIPLGVTKAKERLRDD